MGRTRRINFVHRRIGIKAGRRTGVTKTDISTGIYFSQSLAPHLIYKTLQRLRRLGCMQETAIALGEQPFSLIQWLIPVYIGSSHHTYSAKRWHASAAFPQPAEKPSTTKRHDTVYMFQLFLTVTTPIPPADKYFTLFPFTRTNSAKSWGIIQPLLFLSVACPHHTNQIWGRSAHRSSEQHHLLLFKQLTTKIGAWPLAYDGAEPVCMTLLNWGIPSVWTGLRTQSGSGTQWSDRYLLWATVKIKRRKQTVERCCGFAPGSIWTMEAAYGYGLYCYGQVRM